MLELSSIVRWTMAAVIPLYIWLGLAYGRAGQHSGRRFGWAQGLSWFILITLFRNIYLFDNAQFRIFPLLFFTALLVLPITFIFIHLLGKGRFPGYQHARDVLLLRPPEHVPISSTQARKETIGIGALTLILVLISAVSWSLRPCHWLDRKLTLSGCTQVFLFDGLLQDLTLSPNGSLLAIAANDGVYLWQTKDAQLITSIPYPNGAQSVAFSPDGQLLANGGREHMLFIHRINGTLLQQIPTEDTVESLSFSPDGQLLAAGIGNSVIVWQLENGKQLWTFPSDEEVYSLAYSPDGQTLAVGSYGGAFVLHNPPNTQAPTRLTNAPIYQLAISPDGSLLAGGSSADRIELWQLINGQGHWSFTGSAPEELMWTVAFSPDGSYLVGGSGNNTLNIWRTSDFTLLKTMSFSSQIHNVAVHPDNHTLAIGLWDETVRLWRIP